MMHRRASAFTLIETILALGLSSFLLVAVFALVDSTVHFHVRGNEQLLESQRLLGLLQDLRTDLRATITDPHWAQKLPTIPSDQSELAAQVRALRESIGLRELIGLADQAAEPIALVGDRNWLLLTLAQDNPRLPTARRQDDSANHRQVLWTGRQLNSTLLLPTHSQAGRLINGQVSVPTVEGLWRIELGGTSQRPVSQPLDYPLLILDGQSLGLRYFDGQHWQSRWNSVQQSRLPSAVEINLSQSAPASSRSWIIHLPTAVAASHGQEGV